MIFGETLDSGSFARPVAVSRVVELRQLCDAGQHPAIAARGIAARGCVRVSVLARQRSAGVGDILQKTTRRDVSEFHVHACRAGAQPYRVLRAKRLAVGSLTAAPRVCALAQRWRRTAREEQAVREVRWQHVKQRHHVLLLAEPAGIPVLLQAARMASATTDAPSSISGL